MKKVAFLATSYITQYDGISVYTENLLNELIDILSKEKKNIKLDIYVKSETLPFLKKRIKPANLVSFKEIKNKNFLSFIMYLHKELSVKRYDLVFVPNLAPLFLPSIKTIKVIHDLSYKNFPEDIPYYKKLYITSLIYLSLYKDTAIGYISKTTRKDLNKYFKIPNDKKFLYLPNGIPFKVKNQKRPSLQDVENKFKTKIVKILFVGRINKHKGFDRVLKFIKFADTALEKDEYFDGMEIHVVGKKTKETKDLLGEYIPQNIKIKFWGYLNDDKLNELYRNSQFCFFLSRNEGYGLPLIEALWLRTIPILSDIPIFKEIMGNDYKFFSDIGGYTENIYNFIKKVHKNKEYRNSLIKKMDFVVEKEKDGYKKAAQNLLNFIEKQGKH